MAYRTRRQQRYLKLRQGNLFLPFEAQIFSKMPVRSIPYIREMIRDRQRDLIIARQQNLTLAGWERRIKDMYTANDLIKEGKRGEAKFDAWAMLRKFADDYKDKHPEYVSPGTKKGRKWLDFIAKAERTIAAQQGGRL